MVTKTARRKTSGLRFAVFGLTLLGFICNGACTGAPGPAAGDNSTPDQPLRHPQRIISLTLGTSELDGGVRHHPARGHLLRGIPERGRRARVLRTRENFHRKNSFHQPRRHPDRHRLQPQRGFSGPPAGRLSVRAARCGAPTAGCRLAFPATHGRLAPSGGLRHRPSGRYGRDFNRQNSPGQS